MLLMTPSSTTGSLPLHLFVSSLYRHRSLLFTGLWFTSLSTVTSTSSSLSSYGSKVSITSYLLLLLLIMGMLMLLLLWLRHHHNRWRVKTWSQIWNQTVSGSERRSYVYEILISTYTSLSVVTKPVVSFWAKTSIPIQSKSCSLITSINRFT